MFGGALLRARTAARLALPGVLLVPGLAACGGVTAVVACSAPEQGGAQPRSAGDASPPPAPASSGAQYWGPRVEAFRKEMRRKAGFDTFIHRREPGAEAPSAEELAERSASTLAADWSPEQDAEARWNRTLGQLVLFGIIASGLVISLLRMRRRDPNADFTRAAIATLNASAAVRAKVGAPVSMVGRFQGKAGFNTVDGVLAARTPSHPLLVVELTGRFARAHQDWQFSKLHLVLPAPPGTAAGPDPPGIRPDGFQDGEVVKLV